MKNIFVYQYTDFDKIPIVSYIAIIQYEIFGLYDGLVQNKQQTIAWTEE